MHIVFLIAGRASRFKEAGYTLPKSLIEVRGKLMISWAVDSLHFIKNAHFTFLILSEHEEKFHISKKLKMLYRNEMHIVIVDKVTEGAATTALLAKESINNEEELLISNGDQYFTSKAFREEIEKKDKEFNGLIAVFEATHPRWSFAKVNNSGFVTEVAEKVAISNNATVGVYYFRHGKDFVWAAEEMIRKDIRRNNEFYICPVYNELIGRGDKIKAVRADTMWSLGTPEDVLYFEKYFKEKK